MLPISWFRRFQFRDLSGTRGYQLETTRPHREPAGAAPRTDKLLTASINLCRQYRVSPVCEQIKSSQSPKSFRNSYLYMTPETISEDFRSKVKFLTSKNHQVDVKDAQQPGPGGKPGSTEDDAASRSLMSSEGSIKSDKSASDSISVTATRNETAREFIRPPSYTITELKPSTKNRVTCPKPNSTSPYARGPDEVETGAPTLKDHYTKVLLQPVKPFGITFPASTTKSISSQPKQKSRGYDQYMGSSQGPVMARTVNSKVITRSLQSKSGGHLKQPKVPTPSLESIKNLDSVKSIEGLESKYDIIKKASNNRYLEMCSASDDQVFINNPSFLKRKHVEVVKMEVIKLDKQIKKSKKTTDIKQELEHVLQEALAQSKAFEKNVMQTHQCECEEYEDDDYLHRDRYMNVQVNGGRFGTPRSSHSAVVLDNEKITQAKVSFDGQTRTRVRSHSADGKHCYTVLNPETKKPPEDDSTAEVKLAQENVEDSLTDLNSYEDLSENKMVSQMVSSGYQSGSGESVNCKKLQDENEQLTKLAKDVKIAQRQHNQRLLDVFEIMKGVKLK